MELIDELADAFLYNSMEMYSVLNVETGEILLDVPELLSGEPEIDWESMKHTLKKTRTLHVGTGLYFLQ